MKLGFNAWPPAVIIQWPWFYKTGRGIALGPIVLVKDIGDVKLVKHEIAHVSQGYRGLFVIFWLRYFYYLARVGYRNNPFEIEARRLSEED